jgi:hypothetical protein
MQDFHLTLLKEQLAGSNAGEWLDRYGPGSEGEVSRPLFPLTEISRQVFMPCVWRHHRLQMLSQADIDGLRDELSSIRGPMTSDFTVFRRKIEDAGARHEAAVKRLHHLDEQLTEAVLQVSFTAPV